MAVMTLAEKASLATGMLRGLRQRGVSIEDRLHIARLLLAFAEADTPELQCEPEPEDDRDENQFNVFRGK
jgi:hypothetical protein